MKLRRLLSSAALLATLIFFGPANRVLLFAEGTDWRIKKVAFEASRRDLEGQHTDLYVMDAANAKPQRLAEGSSPSWSPDGQRLAYCIHGANGELEIVVSDGAAKRQLTDLKEGACPPVWSPDSKRIAFTAGSGKTEMIWVVGVDGSSPKAVIAGDISGWSPDGTKLLFHRRGAKGRDDGWIANVDGSEAQIIFKEGSSIIGMAWFPDGKSVVYSSERPGGKSAVFRVNVDGTHMEKFGAGNYQAVFSPVLSPDGKWLVVDAFEKSDAPKFMLVDDGGKLKKEWFYGRHASVVWEKPETPRKPSPGR